MTRRTLGPLLLAAFMGLLLAGPALAAPADPPQAGHHAGAPAADPAAPVLGAGYWDGFFEHWAGVFQKQNGIVLAALLVGAVCLFIITRGKWKD